MYEVSFFGISTNHVFHYLCILVYCYYASRSLFESLFLLADVLSGCSCRRLYYDFMAFLQRTWPRGKMYRASISALFGFDPRMGESVYKGELFSLPDAVLVFVKAFDTKGFVARTNNSPLLVFKAVMRSSEID